MLKWENEKEETLRVRKAEEEMGYGHRNLVLQRQNQKRCEK